MIANVSLGIQGWNHPGLVGRSYPTSVPSSEWLAQYAARLPTVEIDDTFYGIPPEPVVLRWRDSVGAEFSFAPKAPQQITHERRFSKGGGLLARFLDRILLLGEHLGPILLVAPPGFAPDDENKATLRSFVEQLPSDFRWALELKNVGWFTDEIHDMLARANVATVAGESRWIHRSAMLNRTVQPSADFAYIRWCNTAEAGPPSQKVGGEESVTAIWEEPIARLCGLVSSVYGYFHVRAFGDGLRSAEQVQAAIGKCGLEASASQDQQAL